MSSISSDLFKPYQDVRESNCLTDFLDHGCYATQYLVGDKNQFLAKIPKPLPAGNTKHQPFAERNQFSAKITKPPPAEITKPNHELALTVTGFHKFVKPCKSLRCWEVKLSPREVPWILSQLPKEL